jgi:hypothetical protein
MAFRLVNITFLYYIQKRGARHPHGAILPQLSSEQIDYNHETRPMRLIRNAARNLGIAGELMSFFWSKRWWLVPMIVTLFLLMALIMLAQSSAIAPFIYTLF